MSWLPDCDRGGSKLCLRFSFYLSCSCWDSCLLLLRSLAAPVLWISNLGDNNFGSYFFTLSAKVINLPLFSLLHQLNLICTLNILRRYLAQYYLLLLRLSNYSSLWVVDSVDQCSTDSNSILNYIPGLDTLKNFCRDLRPQPSLAGWPLATYLRLKKRFD